MKQGRYELLGKVDDTGAIAESNETNNQFNWTIRVVTGPLTSLAVGQPNYTAGATYVTAATPLGLSPLDQSGTGIRRTMYRVDGGIWVNYSMTGSLELNSEGEHFVEWFSQDFAGNIEPTLNATFRVDDSPPLVVGNPKYLEADIFVTPLTPLSLSALDRGLLPVGLGSTEYRIDGGAWTTYGGPLLLSMEGRNTLELSSSDRLGNAESPHETVVIVDDTAPAISIDVGTPRYEGADTYVTAATRFTLTAVDGGPVPVGVADLEYRVGGAWIPYGAWLVIAEPDGARTLGYRATDFLGHVTTRQLAVVIDGTPPVTTPIPSEGTYTPGTALAFAAADAGSGVARTDVGVDGGPWTPYTAQLVLAEGLHTIRFRSVDYLENLEAERTLSVTIIRAPSVPPSTNWKPMIATFFAAVLSLAGAWSAQRTPWPSGSRRRLRAFALAAFPFVLGEAATGVLSSLTGLLSIPPMLGVGTAVDIGILLASLGVSLYRVRRRTQIA